MAEVSEMEVPKVEKAPEEASKPAKKKGKLKLNLIIILVSQLVLAGGSFYVVSNYIKPDPAFKQALEEPKENGEALAEDGAGGGEHEVEKRIYLLEDIIVNPAGTRGSRYLSVSIGVEMNAATEKNNGGHGGGEEQTPIDHKKPQLRDVLIGILSSKTIVQLSDIEEKEIIRAEILESFKEVLDPLPVYKIYFVDFVLQ